MRDLIRPEWPLAGVEALVTTRAFGDMAAEAKLIERVTPSAPAWLRQVHGTRVVDLDRDTGREADAALTRSSGVVCAIRVADCMPVFLVHEDKTVVAAAHAGWRGLAGGVLEATLDAMRVPAREVTAWMGPAISGRVYEVGDEVRAAFAGHEAAFQATRPGHWLLDLYAVARRRLAERGVQHILGGGFCTYSERERFFSYRRDGARERMAAAIWLT